ncbi:hypothetical protein EVAR_56773_1 [Eumeta japonica]|uniref:Uncharacterized protein n=1 Tax=Eumeta variegata TaxID=151549 RepID=A0A4C1XLU9_EUMVA|nr:hypothetical protein EVAR_56773_1 [Eumeta japonica]
MITISLPLERKNPKKSPKTDSYPRLCPQQIHGGENNQRGSKQSWSRGPPAVHLVRLPLIKLQQRQRLSQRTSKRTVVKRSSWVVPASVDRRKLPAEAFELLRVNNATLRHAFTYPTRENRSRARSLQRWVKARIIEVKNEEWSNFMEDITPTHQAFWEITKALNSEGYRDAPAPGYKIGPIPCWHPNDFLYRGDSLKESPIWQVTRRQHPRVLSGRARGS